MSSLRILPSLTLALVVASAASAGVPWFKGGHPRGPGGMVHVPGGVRWGGHVGIGGGFYSRPVRILPRGYLTYTFGGSPWYMHNGYWYRPWRGAYVGCYPPIGLCLPLLPFGYSTVWFGGTRYYAYEDVYYVDAPAGGYTVVDPPAEREAPRAQPRPGSPDAAALDALLIVPKEGQSEEKMKADRDAAQRYAMDESRYDPARSDPADPGTPRARRAYLKAMRAYLEERGYSVK